MTREETAELRRALGAWARDFAQVLGDRKSGKHKLKMHEMLANTTANVEHSLLRDALKAVSEEGKTNHVVWQLFDKRPEIFDPWFRSTVRYGLLFNEIDVALLRFADGSDEMWYDY